MFVSNIYRKNYEISINAYTYMRLFCIKISICVPESIDLAFKVQSGGPELYREI